MAIARRGNNRQGVAVVVEVLTAWLMAATVTAVAKPMATASNVPSSTDTIARNATERFLPDLA